MKLLREYGDVLLGVFLFVLNCIALPLSLLTENYLQAASNLLFVIIFGYVLKMQYKDMQDKNKPKDPMVEDECQ